MTEKAKRYKLTPAQNGPEPLARPVFKTSLSIEYENIFSVKLICPCSEMDITFGFGPKILGSNPDRGKNKKVIMIYKVYLLKSELSKTYYVGYTGDIKNRLAYHNGGKVKYTNKKKPWFLIGYEE